MSTPVRNPKLFLESCAILTKHSGLLDPMSRLVADVAAACGLQCQLRPVRQIVRRLNGLLQVHLDLLLTPGCPAAIAPSVIDELARACRLQAFAAECRGAAKAHVSWLNGLVGQLDVAEPAVQSQVRRDLLNAVYPHLTGMARAYLNRPSNKNLVRLDDDGDLLQGWCLNWLRGCGNGNFTLTAESRRLPIQQLCGWMIDNFQRYYCRQVLSQGTTRRSRTPSREGSLACQQTAPDPSQEVIREETATAVRAALRELPEEELAVLVARYLNGHSVEETAAALGVTYTTVQGRARRGRRRLRPVLEQEA